MKFCYADESADPNDPVVQVMVGILVDAQRLHRTREEFSEIFDVVSEVFPEGLRELKGSRIFFGRGGWRDVPPETRKAIFQDFCGWVAKRKHHLTMSAIDVAKFETDIPSDFPHEMNDLWVAGAVHISLQLQRKHQTIKQNKGHTVLIFDENKQKADKLNEVLFAPPVWTEPYYDKKKKHGPLNQIIDSAFFTKSHHTGLAQVADLFAFVFRRYAELADYDIASEYKGEMADIEDLVNRLVPRLIGKEHRWPKQPRTECAETFTSLAPKSLAAF